ncbi:MAG: DUF1275 family protein [Acidimicrobiales bacterium]
MAGIVIGSALVEVARQRRARSPAVGVALAEAAMLCPAVGIGQAAATGGKIAPANTAAYATAAAALAGAMGLQTVAMRRAGNRTLRTTFMTGVLINMAQSLVVACFTGQRQRRRRALALSRLFGSLWVAYLAGAVAGGAAERAWSFAALALPIAAAFSMAGWSAGAPLPPGAAGRGLPGARSLSRHPRRTSSWPSTPAGARHGWSPA